MAKAKTPTKTKTPTKPSLLTRTQVKQVAKLRKRDKLTGTAQAPTNASMEQFRLEMEATRADPFVIGKAYLVRTVTMIVTGRVVRVVNNLLVMEDAAWIADTGRFSDALKTGALSEIEPAEGQVLVGLGAIVDVYEWNHELPREQK